MHLFSRKRPDPNSHNMHNLHYPISTALLLTLFTACGGDGGSTKTDTTSTDTTAY